MKILVLEASTTSAKTMVYDTEQGKPVVRTKLFTQTYEDLTVQNPETIFAEMMALGREACRGTEIDIIALSGTFHNLLLCDEEMRPKSPVYLWSNTEAADLCRRLRLEKDYVEAYNQKTGCMVNASYPYFKLRYLKENGYDLSQYRIAGQGSYNMFRLTGEWVIMDSLASGTGLMDIREKTYDRELLAELGIGVSQLPRIVEFRETFPLSGDGAEILGLKEGIPVIATGPDGALNQVGAGALKKGIMTFSVGTSGALRLAARKPVLPETPSIWCYMAPKYWLTGAATSGASNCVDWYKDRMFPEGTTYEAIERGFGAIEDAPVFLPFLFGERSPGWEDDRNGTFMEIRPHHTPHDFYHGILEGVLFNLLQCYEILAELDGVPERIKLSGGILHSEFWTQMCADIFGMDMEVDDVRDSSLMGGAVLGMEVLGVIEDIEDFQTATVKVVHPNAAMAGIYKERYLRYKYWYTTAR